MDGCLDEWDSLGYVRVQRFFWLPRLGLGLRRACRVMIPLGTSSQASRYGVGGKKKKIPAVSYIYISCQ